MEKTIKWGIIGPGRIAQKFAFGLKHLENAELYAVASRSLTRAEEFAEKENVKKAYGSYEELAQDKELDVIYVATPHVFHYEHSLLCLKNKKAVLCEKPFAMNEQQVKKMISTAHEEKVFLMEAMWTHFLPHFKYVLDLIESEKYGKIKSLKADFGMNPDFDPASRLFDKSLGGGSLLDIGIYPVFVALSFLGAPEKITAHGTLSQNKIDNDCEILFHYPNKVRAQLESSIIKRTPTICVLEMEKAKITLNYPFNEPTSVTIESKDGVANREFEVIGNGYYYEAQHVQEMLSLGRIESTEMTFQKSLDLIRLLDEVRKQINLEY